MIVNKLYHTKKILFKDLTIGSKFSWGYYSCKDERKLYSKIIISIDKKKLIYKFLDGSNSKTFTLLLSNVGKDYVYVYDNI